MCIYHTPTGRRCVRRVTVTWSYQEQVGRSVTGLSLLPHPVLGIGCQPTWNSCVRLLHSRANWRVLCFMLLTPGTLCELWNVPSVYLYRSALQVTVVTVTVILLINVGYKMQFLHLYSKFERFCAKQPHYMLYVWDTHNKAFYSILKWPWMQSRSTATAQIKRPHVILSCSR